MSEKFFADVKNIRNAIDSKKLVVFAGAGISVDAGIPIWSTLIDEMTTDITIPSGESDYLRIAQMYFNERMQKDYIDKIRSVLKHKKVSYNEIHEQIFKLNPRHILTTNYDDLLEQVIKKGSHPFSVINDDSEFPYASDTSLLVKIHGDLGNTNIVLKEDDYLDYSLNHPLIEAFLKSIFATNVVLFIGYGLADTNLKMIIQTVRNILGKNFQRPYLLNLDEKLHFAQRRYLEHKGIHVLNYFDAVDEDNGNNFIIKYLEGNNARKEVYYRNGKKLSIKGQNLFNFLNFLCTYDKFNEPLAQKNIIDQMLMSLQRFSELRSLPPQFIANLYPFNNSKWYVRNIDNYTLTTSNMQIYELFLSQIDYSADEITFKPVGGFASEIENVKGYEKKIIEIIQILNQSLLFNVSLSRTDNEYLAHPGQSSKVVKIRSKPPEICNCLTCRVHRFAFTGVLTEIGNSTVNETTSIQDDIELAYVNSKVGNFLHSVRLFEEVANKAWQSGKFISYYIAKRNIKSLRNFVSSYESTLGGQELMTVMQKIDNIDFDILLSRIPYLGQKEYELLKTIRDDDVLLCAANKINSTYEQIVSCYDGYKLGSTFLLGPYYPQAIENEIYKIRYFYAENHIIADEFLNFVNVCNKGLEALLISYATSDDYKQKLQRLNLPFYEVMVLYGEDKRIKAILTKFEINKLEFDEKSMLEILGSVSNFLTSFYEVHPFFSKGTRAEKVTATQIGKNFFAEKCRKKFRNIFLLLGQIQLRETDAPTFVKSLLSFLEHETFLQIPEIEYLSKFLKTNYRIISEEDLKTLLNLSVIKLDFYFQGDFLRSLAAIAKGNNFEGLADRDLIFKVLNWSKSPQEKAETILCLWELSERSIKDDLTQTILEILDASFDKELYVEASYREIIDFNRYFDLYLSHIDMEIQSQQQVSQNDVNHDPSQSFLTALFFIYYKKVSSNDVRLSKLNNLSEQMKFYINPESFQYDTFQPEWLHFVGEEEVFFERWRKIPELKKQIERALKRQFETKLGALYARYFI